MTPPKPLLIFVCHLRTQNTESLSKSQAFQFQASTVLEAPRIHLNKHGDLWLSREPNPEPLTPLVLSQISAFFSILSRCVVTLHFGVFVLVNVVLRWLCLSSHAFLCSPLLIHPSSFLSSLHRPRGHQPVLYLQWA